MVHRHEYGKKDVVVLEAGRYRCSAFAAKFRSYAPRRGTPAARRRRIVAMNGELLANIDSENIGCFYTDHGARSRESRREMNFYGRSRRPARRGIPAAEHASSPCSVGRTQVSMHIPVTTLCTNVRGRKPGNHTAFSALRNLLKF